jgi:cell division protein FtsI/penicillin-binding protein 2
MWRDYKAKKDKKTTSDPRLRLFATLIFLFIGALIYRLYFLQIAQGDWYSALATRQHHSSSLLSPARGSILFHEKLNGQDHLFPLATNKDFAFLYAVPKDIAQPLEVAEKLFDFFDRPRLAEEVALELESQNTQILQTEIDRITASDISDEEKNIQIEVAKRLLSKKEGSVEWQEIKEANLERLINERREEILDLYLKRVDKPGDPYEPLKEKLDDDTILSLYALLASNDDQIISKDNLERRLEKVYFKDSGEELKLEGIAFHMKSHRFYPESKLAASVVGFVAQSEEGQRGRYGLEEFFNDELTGKEGYLNGERGGSNTMIVNNREYVKAQAGSDLILSMDRGVQHQACRYLEAAVSKHQAEGGTVIAVHAKTGAILAICSWPSFDPNNYRDVDDIAVYNNPAILYQYEPGSVFKVVTMAAAIDGAKVNPSTTYHDEGQIMIHGWPKPIRNSDFSTKGAHGLVNMNYVLENSLNTGAIFAMLQIGPNVFANYVKAFGFGEKTGIELGAESPGNIDNLLRKRVREIDAATASFGQGIAVTSLQMLMSYQALANEGVLMKPYIVQSIYHSDGKVEEIKPQAVSQAVSPQTAHTMLAMMVNVVENGHAKAAKIPGYYVGGKTGTAQVAIAGGYSRDKYIHTFIGVAPIDNPQIVMLTRLDAPQGVKFAESTVVPLWREIADFMLKYYQIPKSRIE